jgi:hypothetical protein
LFFTFHASIASARQEVKAPKVMQYYFPISQVVAVRQGVPQGMLATYAQIDWRFG